jgi:hypothetical protein
MTAEEKQQALKAEINSLATQLKNTKTDLALQTEEKKRVMEEFQATK